MVKPARRIARLRWLQQTVKVVPSDFVSEELGSAHVSPRPSVQNEQQLKNGLTFNSACFGEKAKTMISYRQHIM